MDCGEGEGAGERHRGGGALALYCTRGAASERLACTGGEPSMEERQPVPPGGQCQGGVLRDKGRVDGAGARCAARVHIACISIHVHVYTATRAHRHTIACMSCGDARVHLTERGERPDGCECYAISGACQGVSLHRRGSFGCAHGMRCIAMQVIHLLLEQDAELIEQRSYQDQLPFSESSCGQVCASVRACMSSGVCAHVCVRAFQLSRRHAVLP
jgi:hypothetical protein